MSKDSGSKDEGGRENAAEAIASGSLWEAKTPRADGTRKHVVATNPTRASVSAKDTKTGESKRMKRSQFLIAYRQSGKVDGASAWGETDSDSGAIALGPEMRKLKKALARQPRAAIVNVIWTITPALATEIIATEKRNRQASDARVRLYSQDQSEGHWVVTHQGIAFGPDMDLVDGGHRLRGIMSTGVSSDMQVSQYTARDHCESARKNLDCQYTRSKGHVLELDGLVAKGQGKPVAATIDAMRFVDRRLPSVLTKTQTEELFKQRSASIAAVHSRVNSEFLSGVRAALVVAHMKAPSHTENLIELVSSRAGIEPNSAAQLMAQRLGKLQAGGSRAQITSAILSALSIAYLHMRGLTPTKTGAPGKRKSYSITDKQQQKAIKFFLGEHYREPSVAPEAKTKRAA